MSTMRIVVAGYTLYYNVTPWLTFYTIVSTEVKVKMEGTGDEGP